MVGWWNFYNDIIITTHITEGESYNKCQNDSIDDENNDYRIVEVGYNRIYDITNDDSVVEVDNNDNNNNVRSKEVTNLYYDGKETKIGCTRR